MRTLTAIFLLASLVFNAAFVAGYFIFRTPPETLATTEEVTEAVADDLGLNKEQHEKFAALHKKNREEGAKLREAIRLTRESLMTEMSSPSPDPERVQTIQDDLSELQRAYRETSFRNYKAFMEALSPEQRRHVAEKVENHEKRYRRRRFPPGWMRGKPLDRFDANGDGELDEGERAKAREAMLKQFGRRRPWGGRDIGSFGPMPEVASLLKTMRGIRKVMDDLDETQKARVHEAMKRVTNAVASIEDDLAGIFTEEQMEKFRSAKEAGPRRGMGDRRGQRPGRRLPASAETYPENIE